MRKHTSTNSTEDIAICAEGLSQHCRGTGDITPRIRTSGVNQEDAASWHTAGPFRRDTLAPLSPAA